MKVWDISIRQPVFMTMVLIAGIVMGVFSYFRMPVDNFPNVEFPIVVVTTVYPGASPTEVEDNITEVLEEELSTIPGMDMVQSTSSEGFSLLILQFDMDQAADKVSQEVRERINILQNQLPSGAQDPVVQRFNPADQPIMRLGVADKTGELTPAGLRQLVEDKVQAPLQSVANVAAVDVAGGEEREIQVRLDTQAMQARRITAQQIIGALQSENLTIPGGSVMEGEMEMSLRTPGDFQTLDDIRNVIVANRGAPIYLRDVATVVDGTKKRESITRLNGEESVVLNIRKQSGSNTVAVVEGVKEELEHVIAENPDLAIVIASDQSVEVEQSVEGAIEDLLYGAVLAGFVVFIFFRDFRSTIVTIAGLPVIIISSLFFMDLMGIGLNNISLLALALVVGLVIDDAIVVRENILRWLHKGYKPAEAASKGTAEVFLPVLATTATVLAVFLPVAYAEGIIGKFFVDFGLTVSIAMAISFFESLTMAPMLSAYFFSAKEGAGRELDESPTDDQAEASSWLDRFYAGMLRWVMRFKWLTILLAIAIFAGSLYSTRFLTFAFVPPTEQHQFDMSVELPAGTPLDAALQEAVKIEETLRAHPAVTDIFTTVGSTGAPEDLSFFVKLTDGTVSRTVMDQVRQALVNAPGLSFSLGGGPGGAAADITVEVVGLSNTDYNTLGQEAQNVAAQLQGVPGVVDVKLSYQPGRPEMRFVVDRQKAAQLGLSTAQIGSTIRTLVNGEVATTYRGEGTEADIRVQLADQENTGVEEILNLSLLSQTGQLIPLRQVATVEEAAGPNQISRTDGLPVISISMNVAGRPAPEASGEVAALLPAIDLPDGMMVKLGGDAEAQTEGFASLGLAMVLSVVFIYMVLASQFNSFVQPLLIMLALPLAIVGALLGLLVTGRALDLTAFIGFIMLMGLVTKNGILLVDFANHFRGRGYNAAEAMLHAGPVRLRPILMTSLSMILAMIPLVLGISAGGEFRQSMSIAIMGGLITSTLLTLLVVPAAYGLVVGWQERLAARSAARRSAREAERAAQRELQTSDGGATAPASD
jgi:HAE1 family hydrophobic/amphiphilic exporter-1